MGDTVSCSLGTTIQSATLTLLVPAIYNYLYHHHLLYQYRYSQIGWSKFWHAKFLSRQKLPISWLPFGLLPNIAHISVSHNYLASGGKFSTQILECQNLGTQTIKINTTHEVS
jgi:hypothetical protein